MRRNGVLTVSLVALISTFGFTAATAQTNGVRPVIEANEARFSAFFAKGDVKSVSELYTETGKLLPPNGEIVEGRDKIRDFWRGVWDSGVKKLETKTAEVIGTGTTVSEVGGYKLFGSGGELLDEGKFIVIWKKERGNWLLHRDMWSSNRK
jgi:ketosteroid isomerase-like protein